MERMRQVRMFDQCAGADLSTQHSDGDGDDDGDDDGADSDANRYTGLSHVSATVRTPIILSRKHI